METPQMTEYEWFSHSADLMFGKTYAERLLAEFVQTAVRCRRLRRALETRGDELPDARLLQMQLGAMESYLGLLTIRALKCGLDVPLYLLREDDDEF